ncbi:hypothetical protein KDL01_30020 [Actinospica durhamensis]|uniref:Uncharacterized protein n=1 Tax=Actinospica durhamensis TaxID=1508375 RepID=A0A941IRN6_9ACTN|nr:hypothetical protein [Actinospica durhamensis]MBR7837554.1 hypothetical protein [Actinospica durhamensis]
MAEHVHPAYLRTLRTVAERRAVDEAEAVLTAAWIDQLAAARTEVLGAIAVVKAAQASARTQLRAAQQGVRPAVIACAHQRLELAERAHTDELAAAHAFLDRIDGHLEQARWTATFRQARQREDLEQLRRAWSAAHASSASNESSDGDAWTADLTGPSHE